MTRIELSTLINAPVEVCFDLSRSIDLHQFTTKETNERAIGGRMGGLIEEGEFVKWRATHFFIPQTMTVQIKEMIEPTYFVDEMIQGPFKSMKHIHTFETQGETTIMSDVFDYDVPFGLAGKVFNTIILQSYMKRFLIQRNEIIKQVAESGEWKQFLTHVD